MQAFVWYWRLGAGLHFTARYQTGTLETWICQNWQHDEHVSLEPLWYVLRMPCGAGGEVS